MFPIHSDGPCLQMTDALSFLSILNEFVSERILKIKKLLDMSKEDTYSPMNDNLKSTKSTISSIAGTTRSRKQSLASGHLLMT